MEWLQSKTKSYFFLVTLSSFRLVSEYKLYYYSYQSVQNISISLHCKFELCICYNNHRKSVFNSLTQRKIC